MSWRSSLGGRFTTYRRRRCGCGAAGCCNCRWRRHRWDLPGSLQERVMGSLDPVQLRLTREQLVEGVPARANWPAPDCSTQFSKDAEGGVAEHRYLATRGALDDYVDGKKEQDIISARPRAELKR